MAEDTNSLSLNLLRGSTEVSLPGRITAVVIAQVVTIQKGVIRSQAGIKARDHIGRSNAIMRWRWVIESRGMGVGGSAGGNSLSF